MERQRITVGVTGHRFLTDIGRIRSGIAKALRRIEHTFPGAAITLLSSLGEGSDRIVAREVLSRPYARLIAVLPFPEERYIVDFPSAESRAEFDTLLHQAERVVVMPPQPESTAGYRAAGDYVADHSDVLLAIWDGLEAQGPGGTAEVVARAREQRKPLVVVRAGNRTPGTEDPTTLGQEQGRVIVERL